MAENQDSITESLQAQVRQEINGEEVTNPQKFALEQKFGLTDPVLTNDERVAIAAEEAQIGQV